MRKAGVRQLDQSRIGAVLTGDPTDLRDGPPITAMLIQNTNPAQVAPEQRKVKRGFAREDLFVCVHEQFMTPTARMADVVIPATMFLEHDDVYQSGGNQHILLGPKLIEPPGECRSNHDVISDLARRVGAEHRGFDMTPREIIDATLQASGWGTLDELEVAKWIDCQPNFETAHYLNGFAHPDGKFHFAPDWTGVKMVNAGPMGPHEEMPKLPDFWEVIEKTDAKHPFRLATSPSRSYLELQLQRDADRARPRRAARGARSIQRTWRGSVLPTTSASPWATSAARSGSWRGRSTACSRAS